MIEVKGLSMTYGKRKVLKDISFKVEDGKTIGLLGINGAGKSTLMNIITGYLKPDAGEIYIDNIDMRKNPKEGKKRIGYLPEIPPLYKDMRVVEYLSFVAELKYVKNKKEEVQRVLQLMNLESRKLDFIKNLSKGLQQRVGFAQALLGNPDVLILDEPLVGLDPTEAKNTRALIRSLQEQKINIIISSHILTEIEELCGSILMIKDGSVVLDESMASAKRKGNKCMYRLLVKGNHSQIEEMLQQYDQIKETEFICEREPNVYEFVIHTKSKRDIRDNIIGYLVSKKFSVYGIERMEESLEEVFVKLNNGEEA